jgi:glycosyltransferase involved in cell wall biosynthesis
MRYLWDLYPAYLHEWTHSRLKRGLLAPLTNYLRLWDFASAARVDQFIANSRNVQNRIWRAYRRPSEIVYPPVAVESFHYGEPEDYFLIVSELVAYKRLDDAVRSFTSSGRPLKIVGDGPEYRRLKKLAGDNIEFCGRVPNTQLTNLYAHCRAVLSPGEEDFGIFAIEALASGKAVIGLGRGGVAESIPESDPRAGFLYAQNGAEHLETAIQEFERKEKFLSPIALQDYASHFSEEAFRSHMSKILFDGTSTEVPPTFVGDSKVGIYE